MRLSPTKRIAPPFSQQSRPLIIHIPGLAGCVDHHIIIQDRQGSANRIDCCESFKRSIQPVGEDRQTIRYYAAGLDDGLDRLDGTATRRDEVLDQQYLLSLVGTVRSQTFDDIA